MASGFCFCWIHLLTLVLSSSLSASPPRYTLHRTRLSFDRASEVCSPGVLATLATEQEVADVLRLVSRSLPPQNEFSFWVGLKKPKNKCVVPTLPLRGFRWTEDDSEESQVILWAKEPQDTCTTVRCAALQGRVHGSTVQRWGLVPVTCRNTSVHQFICKLRDRRMGPTSEDRVTPDTPAAPEPVTAGPGPAAPEPPQPAKPGPGPAGPETPKPGSAAPEPPQPAKPGPGPAGPETSKPEQEPAGPEPSTPEQEPAGPETPKPGSAAPEPPQPAKPGPGSAGPETSKPDQEPPGPEPPKHEPELPVRGPEVETDQKPKLQVPDPGPDPGLDSGPGVGSDLCKRPFVLGARYLRPDPDNSSRLQVECWSTVQLELHCRGRPAAWHLLDDSLANFTSVCQLCSDGFTKDVSANCVDIDECSGAPCRRTCVNTEGSFRCVCSDENGKQHDEGSAACSLTVTVDDAGVLVPVLVAVAVLVVLVVVVAVTVKCCLIRRTKRRAVKKKSEKMAMKDSFATANERTAT
ncbi:putative complement component C1q receptor-like [Scophthalmus maximus]|nr:putative complement component C1q receptor-like [Scophthalmus maximus]